MLFLEDKMNKSLTLKKVQIFAVCIFMALIVLLSFTACGEKSNDYITVGKDASFSGSDVKFNNAKDFELVYLGDNKYEAKGSPAIMTSEQASAWGTVEGSKYVVINVKMGAGSTSIVGWRNVDTQDNAFEQSEIDGSLIKNSSAKNDTKNYILALSDGEIERHPDLKIWRIEVTPASSDGQAEKVVYTIDFSAMYE